MSLGLVDCLGLPKRALSEIQVNSGVGHGTSGTRAVRLSALTYQTGSAVTWVPDPVDGDTFYINEESRYAVQLFMGSSAAAETFGAVKNTKATGTGILSQTNTDVICLGYAAAASSIACSAGIVSLKPGDFIKIISNGGNTPWSNNLVGVRITKID